MTPKAFEFTKSFWKSVSVCTILFGIHFFLLVDTFPGSRGSLSMFMGNNNFGFAFVEVLTSQTGERFYSKETNSNFKKVYFLS
jgi:hypothetical protein